MLKKILISCLFLILGKINFIYPMHKNPFKKAFCLKNLTKNLNKKNTQKHTSPKINPIKYNFLPTESIWDNSEKKEECTKHQEKPLKCPYINRYLFLPAESIWGDHVDQDENIKQEEILKEIEEELEFFC